MLDDPLNIAGKFGAVVIGVIIAMGVVGNVLVLVVIASNPNLRRSYNVFIASLSITDLIFNVAIMPFYADSYFRRNWIHSWQLCLFVTFFGTVVIMSSSLHIAFIAVNRYFFIVRPAVYPRVASPKALALQILVIWTVPLAVVLPGAFGWNALIRYTDQIGRCTYVRAESRVSISMVFCVGFICPCVVMGLCYTMIYRRTRQSSKRMVHYGHDPRVSCRGSGVEDPLPVKSAVQSVDFRAFPVKTEDDVCRAAESGAERGMGDAENVVLPGSNGSSRLNVIQSSHGGTISKASEGQLQGRAEHATQSQDMPGCSGQFEDMPKSAGQLQDMQKYVEQSHDTTGHTKEFQDMSRCAGHLEDRTLRPGQLKWISDVTDATMRHHSSSADDAVSHETAKKKERETQPLPASETTKAETTKITRAEPTGNVEAEPVKHVGEEIMGVDKAERTGITEAEPTERDEAETAEVVEAESMRIAQAEQKDIGQSISGEATDARPRLVNRKYQETEEETKRLLTAKVRSSHGRSATVVDPRSGLLYVHPTNHGSAKNRMHSMRMILAIFFAFVLTYLPFTITNLVDQYSSFSRSWYMITSLGFWAGSCVNPIIYGIMNKQFRAGYGGVLFGCYNAASAIGNLRRTI